MIKHSPYRSYYWMCKSDQWLIIPSIRITVEKATFGFIVGFELGFLNRWCAVEFSFMKEVDRG